MVVDSCYRRIDIGYPQATVKVDIFQLQIRIIYITTHRAMFNTRVPGTP